MIDGLIKNTGDSRLIKSAAANLPATYDVFRSMMGGGGIPIDLILNPDGWQPLGTLLSKATLLTDFTAAAYGFTDADTTVNDVFDLISFTGQHVWIRRERSKYTIASGANVSTTVTSATTAATSVTVYYTDTLSINPDTGALIPGTIQSVLVSYNTYTNANVLKGKYWSLTASLLANVFYTAPNAADATRGTAASPYTVSIYASTRTPLLNNGPFPFEVLYSSDENAYPHSDTEEYRYTYIEKYKDIAQAILSFTAVSGTYTGNGATTRSIDLGFTPSAVFLFAAGQAPNNATAVLAVGLSQALYYSNSQYAYLTISANGFELSGNNALNSNNSKFNYVAFR